MAFDTWWVALIVTLLFGGIASAYLRQAKRGRFEANAGLDALKGLHLREFAYFVLDAMRHRGFDMDSSVTLAQAAPSDRMLLRNGTHWLLSCRHGKAALLTATDVREMVDAIRLQQADGGLLVTASDVSAEVRKAAGKTRIELVFGTGLWTEIAPYLPETMKQEVSDEAASHSKRLLGLVWLIALALGVATWFVTGQLQDQRAAIPIAANTTPAQPVPEVAARTPVAVPPNENATTRQVSTTQAAPNAAPSEPDPAKQALLREKVEKAISALPGIDQAIWSSHSTLLVHLQDAKADPLAEICAVLDQYESLLTSRIMLQPPPASGATVQFRQCEVIWGSD